MLGTLIPFEPAAWAKDRHTQTILGDILPSPKMRELGDRLLVQLEDGDQLFCRLHNGSSPFVFLLCHGLTGNSEAGYIQRLTHELLLLGHSVCRMNHRNCGESLGLSKNPYHSGRSDDLARITFDLRKIYPQKKVICIGFSMSGNACLLLSAGILPTQGVYTREHFVTKSAQKKWSSPDSFIAVNPPGDLSKASDGFMRNMNRFYQWNFIRNFQKMITDLQDLDLLEMYYKTTPLMSIRKFDDVYTSKRSGFQSAEEYYDKCSSLKYLVNTDTPTYILASEDDPIIDYADLNSAPKSKFITIHATKNGGHMGFLAKSKTPQGSFRWMDYAILEMVNDLTT